MPPPSQDKDHEPANPLRIPAQADASLALAQRDADAAPIDQCVLHIAWSDRWAGATTVFFLYVVNQIIYADMHGLKVRALTPASSTSLTPMTPLPMREKYSRAPLELTSAFPAPRPANQPWVHLAAGNTWVYDATVHRGHHRSPPAQLQL